MTARNTPDSSAQGGNGAEAGARPNTNGIVIDLPVNYGKASADEDSRVSPYPQQSTTAAKELAVQQAAEKRLQQWATKRYAVASLAGRTEKWARKVVSDIDRWNAGRDPTKDLPELVFSGDKAVQAGATDADMAALEAHALTYSGLGALRIEAAALREHGRAQVRRKAASMATPRKPLAEVIRHVTDMANDPPTGTVVDGLLYEQTVTHWIGDGGTYKTFTVMSLACSVAAGRNFTDHRLKVPAKLPVLYFCAERRHYGMGADVHAWCQVNGVDISDLELLGWDDVVQLADDDWMAELTDYVTERGIKLVVFDTQRKATKGIEENSSTDIGAALANAQKLAMAASAAVIVIHHTARGQNHARGTTAARDDTDATVVQTLTGSPNEAEFVINKHKSEATGTRFPVKVQALSGFMPPTKDRAGYEYTTMVSAARDPMSMDDAAAQMHAALDHNDKILVAVVNDNTGPALTPAEVARRATERGCGLKKDAVTKHLQTLAKPAYGQITEHVNKVTNRRTYSPKNAAPAPADAPDGDA